MEHQALGYCRASGSMVVTLEERETQMTAGEVVSVSFPPSQHPWQVPCLGRAETLRLALGKGEDLPDSKKGTTGGGLAMEPT